MTKYSVAPDMDAEDPRAWDMDTPDEIIVWDGGRWGAPEFTGDDPLNAVYQLAWDGNKTFDQAIEIVNRWDRVFHDGKRQVDVTTVRGYSQSDWWKLVHLVRADVETFAQYLRGDVWVVTEYWEETCNLGHTHRDAAFTVGGIYADSEEDAIEMFKEGV